MQSHEQQPNQRPAVSTSSGNRKLDLPTSSQLRTAIQVLEKLSERLTEESTHSVKQMPNSPLGDNYATKVGKDAAEKISRIDGLKQQLENWQQELKELRRQYVSSRI